MYSIRYAQAVKDELAALRAFERRQLLSRIDQQLLHEPMTETRNRKRLVGLVPPWEHEPPVWELRSGKFRIFYDVDEAEQLVVVRAIRQKPPHATTEEIL
jgi:mRNA-degrading endonuclease RelE of RelBE toxin-antitoxin system